MPAPTRGATGPQGTQPLPPIQLRTGTKSWPFGLSRAQICRQLLIDLLDIANARNRRNEKHAPAPESSAHLCLTGSACYTRRFPTTIRKRDDEAILAGDASHRRCG